MPTPAPIECLSDRSRRLREESAELLLESGALAEESIQKCEDARRLIARHAAVARSLADQRGRERSRPR